MIFDAVGLLGRKWIHRRRRASSSSNRSNSSSQVHRVEVFAPFQLDMLERRVLFSSDPILSTAPSALEDPDEIVVNHIHDAPDDISQLQTPDGPVQLSPESSPNDGGSDTNTDISQAPGSNSVPFGAAQTDTSEFMIGDVQVTVVLLESDGSIDANLENWTQTEINEVKSEILVGLNWWENLFDLQGSRHDLNFNIDFTYADSPVSTSYEPITHPQTEESLWINDFLGAVQYTNSASIFHNLDQWNHDQRIANGTDWAFTLFVIDSSADIDGKFDKGELVDGLFAYTYRGGPFSVMTYDNGGWNIGRMDRVLAHEVPHIFYALDEYPASDSFNDRSGYLNIQNANAHKDHPNPSSRTASIMAEASLLTSAWDNNTSSISSLETIGWRDTDGDGIFDILDVPLSLTGNGVYNAVTQTYSFTGSSSVQTLPNLNPKGVGNNITLNTVDRLQYRLDGGAWIDGALYGEPIASVDQSVTVSSLGNYTIEFRTIVDETGLSSNIWSDTFVVAPDVLITPASGLETTELGGTATFDVALATQPTEDVTVSFTSNNTSEGTVNVASLLFTSANWNLIQTVTVTGEDDDEVDGDIVYAIITTTTSNDDSYNGLTVQDIGVTNEDDEVPDGLLIDFSNFVIESYGAGEDGLGVATVEDAGATLHLVGDLWKKISLSYNVTVNTVIELDFRSSSQGDIQTIGFDTTDNPNNLQNFRLWGTQDWGISNFDDYALSTPGTKHYVIPVGQFYTGQMTHVTFVNDHDVNTPTSESVYSNILIHEGTAVPGGISVTPTSGLETTEAEGTATFDVVLTTQPLADVTIELASSNTSEGTIDLSSLLFTSANWNVPQTVTITGVDDDIDDDDVAYTITTAAALSNDLSYKDLDAEDVSVTNIDNDQILEDIIDFSQFVILPYGAGEDGLGFATVENNGATLRLVGDLWKKISLPYNVTENTILEFDYRSSNEGEIHALGFVTEDNPNTFQNFRLYGTQDWGISDFDDYALSTPGTRHYVIPVGQFYTGQTTHVSFVNDHDVNSPTAESVYSNIIIREAGGGTSGVTVTPTSGLETTELGGTATFDVVLTSQPTADVTIDLTSSNTSEGTVSDSSLLFTASNWNVAQTGDDHGRE